MGVYMFKNKKRLKELEDTRLELEKEKQELLFIKEQLDNTMPKIDISNVYVWYDNDIYSYAYLSPIYAVDRNILAYTDKMVPMYVLQQLYYKLNNVDVNAKILKK